MVKWNLNLHNAFTMRLKNASVFVRSRFPLVIFARILVHRFVGKTIGVLFALPFLFFVYDSLLSLSNAFSIPMFLEIILTVFLGTFFAVLVHEFGHLITLNLLGSTGVIELSFLIFKIKTKLLTDHLRLSTKVNLLFRGIAGLFANFLIGLAFYLSHLFFYARFIFGMASLQFLACIGATAWFLRYKNSDVAKLAEALSSSDNLNIEKIKAIGNVIEMTIRVGCQQKKEGFLNYWVEFQNIVDAHLELGDSSFFIFNKDRSTLLVSKSVPFKEDLILLKAKIIGDVTIISKCGTTLSVPIKSLN